MLGHPSDLLAKNDQSTGQFPQVGSRVGDYLGWFSRVQLAFRSIGQAEEEGIKGGSGCYRWRAWWLRGCFVSFEFRLGGDYDRGN